MFQNPPSGYQQRANLFNNPGLSSPSEQPYSNPLLTPELKQQYNKGVLGDGYTMDQYAKNFRNNAIKITSQNPELSSIKMTNNAFDGAQEMMMKAGKQHFEQMSNVAPKASPLGMLPAVGNVFDLADALISGKEEIKLDRLAFEGVDYNPIIQANNAAINRSINTNTFNVQNNARTFGQSNAATSAGQARGAQMIGENQATLGTQERNTNSEIFNKERLLNQQIDTQEQDMQRQVDMAHQQRIMSNIAGIGTSIAGFGADSAMMNATNMFNNNFMEAMKYGSPMLKHSMSQAGLTMGTIYDK